MQYATLSGNACGTFGSATTIVGTPVQTATSSDGCYRYTLTGTDNVGNTTSISTIVKVDTVAPATTITFNPASPNGSNGWYKTPAPTFTLSASDAGSGVGGTQYQIDNGAATAYTDAVTIPEGQHTVSYWSTDNAGNVEAAHTTAPIKVDTVTPGNVLSLVNQGTLNGQATSLLSGTTLYYNGSATGGRTFQIQNALTDATSGPASAGFPAISLNGMTHSSDTISTPAGGPYTSTAYTWTSAATFTGSTTITGTDTAGNTNTGTALTFVNDTTGPGTGGALTVNGTPASSGGSTSTTTASFTIGTRTDYSETQSATASGLASSVLTVQSETLSGGTCGAPGSGGPFPSAVTITGTTQPAGIVGGYCYLYTLTGTDNVGNTSSVKTAVKAMDSFQIGNPGLQAAGSPFTVTITAQFDGSTDTTYTGTKTIAFSGPGIAPDGTTATYPASVSFSNGVGTTSNITLVKAESTTLTATDGLITGTSASFTVNAGSAARLAWVPVSNTNGTLSGTCMFTCTYTNVGNAGSTFKAKLAITDSRGNVVSTYGSSLSVTVTKTGSDGSFTGSATVTIPASGQAISNSGGDGATAGEITFVTGSGGGWGPDSLTAAAGTFTGTNAATANFSK
jgi:hypothetical protein